MDLIRFLSRKGLTQAELAKLLETTPGNVNRWVKGDGSPSFELCVKLLNLGMTQEELFGIPRKPDVPAPTSLLDFLETFQKVMNSAIDEMKAKIR